MKMTLELPPDLSSALAREVARRGTTAEALTLRALQQELQHPRQTTPQPNTQEALAALKTTPAPQTLAELRPQQSPPAGKTAVEMIFGQWPGEESDDDLQAQLKALG